MEYKSSNPFFYFIFIAPIFIMPMMDYFQNVAFNMQSFIVSLVVCGAFTVTLAEYYNSIFLESDGIYTRKFYQKNVKLLIKFHNIQSLTITELSGKVNSLEVLSKQKKLSKIQNFHPEFDDFLQKLAEHHPIRKRYHELPNSPFSQEASKGVMALFLMVFTVFFILLMIE